MRNVILALLTAGSLLFAGGPEYTSDGKLIRPADYREWIFLSSGLGMTYGSTTNHEPEFTNVFVSPAAYKAFLETGKWPDKTMFILEVRQPASHGSINKAGQYQSDLA